MTQPADTQLGAANGGAYAFARNGYGRAETNDLTTADLESATVYGHGNETIGSIRSLKIDANGTITDALIDVGGFLRMGAHFVSFPLSQLTILQSTDGSGLRIHLDTTEKKLRPMSFYDK